MKRAPRIIMVVFVALELLVSPTLYALSPEQKKLIESGVYYFNVEQTQYGGCYGAAQTVDPSTNKAITWNFLATQEFEGKRLQPHQIAGIMGNLQSESGGTWDPRVVEFGFPNSKGVISKPGDPSTWDDVVPPDVNGKGQPGYGLVQWTLPERKQGLRDLSEERGVNAGNLELQLEYLWIELTTDYKNSTLLPVLNAADVNESTDIFLEKYENPAKIEKTRPVRREQAAAILVEFGSSSPSATGAVSSSSTGGCFGGSDINGVDCPAVLEPHPTREGYYKMPEAPNEEYVLTSGDARRYGSKTLVCVLHTVGLAFAQAMQGKSRLFIGDLNAGEPHVSHNNGVANDLSGQGELQVASHNKPAKGVYDNDATILLGKMFVDTGTLRNIWWCEPGANVGGLSGSTGSMDAIREYGESKGNPVAIKCIKGHKDHFHIDLNAEYELPGDFTP